VLKILICTISGFCCKAEENCALLGYYAASSGDSLPTFRDKLSVLSSTICLKMGPIGCPKTSVMSYSLRNNPEKCSSQDCIYLSQCWQFNSVAEYLHTRNFCGTSNKIITCIWKQQSRERVTKNNDSHYRWIMYMSSTLYSQFLEKEMKKIFTIVYSATQYTDLNKAFFTLQHYGFHGMCFIYAGTKCTPVAKQNFIQLTSAWHTFLKNTCIKFHGNPRNF